MIEKNNAYTFKSMNNVIENSSSIYRAETNLDDIATPSPSDDSESQQIPIETSQYAQPKARHTIPDLSKVKRGSGLNTCDEDRNAKSKKFDIDKISH